MSNQTNFGRGTISNNTLSRYVVPEVDPFFLAERSVQESGKSAVTSYVIMNYRLGCLVRNAESIEEAIRRGENKIATIVGEDLGTERTGDPVLDKIRFESGWLQNYTQESKSTEEDSEK